jgi:predicted cation transporter
MKLNVSKIAKAVTGFLVAGGLVFDAATQVATAGGDSVTPNEWVRIAVSGLVAGLAVYAVPNGTSEPEATESSP